MTELPTRLEVEDLQQNLRRVQKGLAHKADPATLRVQLDRLHPADVAYILEALPLAERQVVWDLVKIEREGEILLELSEAVRESLIATMEPKELVAAAETLEADEIADLAPDLPEQVVQDVIRAAARAQSDPGELLAQARRQGARLGDPERRALGLATLFLL